MKYVLPVDKDIEIVFCTHSVSDGVCIVLKLKPNDVNRPTLHLLLFNARQGNVSVVSVFLFTFRTVGERTVGIRLTPCFYN